MLLKGAEIIFLLHCSTAPKVGIHLLLVGPRQPDGSPGVDVAAGHAAQKNVLRYSNRARRVLLFCLFFPRNEAIDYLAT